ncbi:hypothetical protein BMS3Abin03_02231 [bacterium BMS3Abin03]|nr:hypothetical protein BMS3Abin03_02231 [bacterium BMS3Abin03]HDZ59146.1 hypothetical protein [Ignavibacteriales bacterium]
MTEKEFISHHILKHSNDLKNFPEDFTNLESTKELIVPAETLVPGNELFGSYEIIKTDGTPVLQAESIQKAKYIIYASGKRSGTIRIPNDKSLIIQAVEKYDAYLDSLLQEITKEFKNTFPDSQNIHSATSEIFKKLNLVRI